jgi:uncharacterized protein YjiK
MLEKIINAFLMFVIAFNFTGCSETKTENPKIKNLTDSRLQLVGKYRLSVPEPSGLALAVEDGFLWTVSDENSTLYKIDIHGAVKDSLVMEGIDLEGVTLLYDSTLCVITERDRGVLILDKEYNIKKRIQLDIEGELNSGIEGVTQNLINKHIYIVNEKNPPLLVELDNDYSIISKLQLELAKDYSGLQFDSSGKYIWIISDESQMLLKVDLKGNIVNSYKIDIPQIEGVAIDFNKKLVYIVSDNTECLYVFMFTKSI